MTDTFAANHTQARLAIAAAARRAVKDGMILASEQEEVAKAAQRSLQMTGTAYLCGTTITFTRHAQDTRLAASIRKMTDEQFDRCFYGL